MQKKVEEREAEKARRRKLEKEARKQHGCKAKTQKAAADHHEAGTAGKPLDIATETRVHGEDEGSVPPHGILRNQIHIVDVIK